MSRGIILLALSSLLLYGCHNKQTEYLPIDLPQIKAKGEITAVTLNSSTSYFQYKMESMGYEYDLIRDFANTHGLKLNIKVAESTNRLVEMLKDGEADIVAYPIPYNNELKKEVLYCGREEESSQVLIQREGKGKQTLKDVTELIGKEVHVKSHTKYAERLKNLNAELGGGINIIEISNDSTSVEDLIEMVSRGEIQYTISDDKTARLNKTYFWNININLQVSFLQRSSWLVRNDSPILADAINKWASNNIGDHTYKAAIKRYFELSKQPIEATMPEIKNGHISPYDNLFKKYAKMLDWDWQILASIAYQESSFKLDKVSWAGAYGLMGIMPGTAKFHGVSIHELNSPEVSIRTGAEVIRRFRGGLSDITDPLEKIKFTLGSYNAGIGHIYDAQKLARKYGKDPTVWDNNVAEFIRLKSNPEYYNDSVCKHGYLRGSETFLYVNEVLERYNYYKQKTEK